MPKNLIPVVAIVIAIFSACTKSQKNIPDQPKTSKIKIEIVAGNNQNDTIGNYLKDSIVIRLTKDDQPLAKYKVQFTGSGCDNYLVQEQAANSQGEVKYSWHLSAEIGRQSLKIIAVDELGRKADSLSAVANAMKPAHGWLSSACTPDIPYGLFARLSTGRLLNINSERTIYSDDNAISWHKLTANQFSALSYLTITPQDEIFLCANSSLYYSRDQGISWELRSPFKDGGSAQAAIFTKNNLLFICYSFSPTPYAVYISKDKGLHWDPAVSAPTSAFQDISEVKNGDLFYREQGGELYQSSADGQKWQQVMPNLHKRMWGVAGDNNGNIYISQLDDNKQLLLKSTDGGKTYHSVYQDYGVFAFMKTQSDGNIYAWNIARGISKIDVTTDVVTSVTPLSSVGSSSFILAKNNSLVFTNAPSNSKKHGTIMYLLP